MLREAYSILAVLSSFRCSPLCYTQPAGEKRPSSLEKRDARVLVEAARKGDLAALRQELDRGVDINEGVSGYSALSVAAGRNDLEALKLLLQKGAAVNSKTTENPLHAAARSGAFDATRLLVERGADVNLVNSRNLNALNWAATWGHTKIVEFLITRGANVNLVDKVCGNARLQISHTPMRRMCALGKHTARWSKQALTSISRTRPESQAFTGRFIRFDPALLTLVACSYQGRQPSAEGQQTGEHPSS